MNKEKRDELKRLCEELKDLPMIAKGLDAIGEPIFRNAIPELLAQVDELEAEVKLCRERLGPAGYKILEKVAKYEKALRAVTQDAIEIGQAKGSIRQEYSITAWAFNKVTEALADDAEKELE